jgi:glycolate oxidase
MMARLMHGSLGTLGKIDEIHMTGECMPDPKTTFLLFFDDDNPPPSNMAEIIQSIREFSPITLDYLDAKAVKLTNERIPNNHFLEPGGHMFQVDVDERMSNDFRKFTKSILPRPSVIAFPESQYDSYEAIRIAVHSKLQEIKGANATFFNPVGGTTVPDDESGLILMRNMEDFGKTQGIEVFQYGHPGYGDYHMKWILEKDARKYTQGMRMYEELYRQAQILGGYMTGDPGVYMSRVDYLRELWGDELLGIMKKIKKAFDPNNVYNPEVMFSQTRGYRDNTLFSITK